MKRNANMLNILKKERFCRFYRFLCKNAVPCLSPKRTFVLRCNTYKKLCICNIHNIKGALKKYYASESNFCTLTPTNKHQSLQNSVQNHTK